MILLFSASPRRREFLEILGIQPYILPLNIPEENFPSEEPLDYLKRITLEKARVGLLSFNSPEEHSIDNILGISGDTIVVYKNAIIQKPDSRDHAFDILSSLSGHTHTVHSGITLSGFLDGKNFEIYDYDTTTIQFKNWTENEIYTYIDTMRPYDKAGSYGIQDSLTPVDSFIGSYSNVVGLPLRKLLRYSELLFDRRF